MPNGRKPHWKVKPSIKLWTVVLIENGKTSYPGQGGYSTTNVFLAPKMRRDQAGRIKYHLKKLHPRAQIKIVEALPPLIGPNR